MFGEGLENVRSINNLIFFSHLIIIYQYVKWFIETANLYISISHHMTPNSIIYIEKLNTWNFYLNYIFEVNTSEFIRYLGPYQLGEHSLPPLLLCLHNMSSCIFFLQMNKSCILKRSKSPACMERWFSS
jgi:hypothetical protein